MPKRSQPVKMLVATAAVAGLAAATVATPVWANETSTESNTSATEQLPGLPDPGLPDPELPIDPTDPTALIDLELILSLLVPVCEGGPDAAPQVPELPGLADVLAILCGWDVPVDPTDPVPPVDPQPPVDEPAQ